MVRDERWQSKTVEVGPLSGGSDVKCHPMGTWSCVIIDVGDNSCWVCPSQGYSVGCENPARDRMQHL